MEVVETEQPQYVEIDSYEMRRRHRAYVTRKVVRGVKWGLIAAGAVAVFKHVTKDKTEDTVEL